MAPHRTGKLLVLSADTSLAQQIPALLPDFELAFASNVAEATVALLDAQLDVVLLDMEGPFAAGLGSGPQDPVVAALAIDPTVKIIALVPEGRRDLAAQAIDAGAADFYHRPVETAVLPLILRRALRVRELELENRELRDGRHAAMAESGLIGASEAMRVAYRFAEKVAPTGATVLVLGESGTGKELLARALHRLSERAARPFCAINCAAIPENLLETELFGHEKGAFTGAIKQTQGRFELAAGGTVFLDEIGEMAPSLQAKLLRVLQDRVVERVGGRSAIPLDIRIVCATNKDLVKLIAEHRFRDDLFYRISEVTIRIPPLRERDGDALLLARYFLRESVRRNRRSIRGFSPEASRAIVNAQWPGNVRELENRVNAAVIMAEGTMITPADLGMPVEQDEGASPSLRDVRQDAERRAVQQALAICGGNLTRTARALGVTRPTLYDLLARLGIDASCLAGNELQ